jgi:hypothetical protein
MNDLMQKLAISKKIMDKHNDVPRGQNQLPIMNENVNANYNIPENILNEEVQKPRIQETINTKPISQEAVLKSRLPDEIKKLMIENPIVQPELNGPTLSNEIIEGASRLMNKKQKDVIVKESNQTTNNNDLKQMIRDVVRDTVRDVVKEELQNAGLLTESTQNTNETLSLRVGKHVFEGKVLKIKKIKQ